MDNIIIIFVLLVMVSVLVVAHEWGHFIVARLFKIRVDDFSIGFGPRLLRLGKLGDTEYNIRAFPLGGFVKIAGMDADEEPLTKAKDALTKSNGKNGDSASVAADTFSDDGEVVNNTDLFNSKPIWQRSLVILAGPGASFLFGVLVFCLAGATVGLPGGVTTSRIAEVMPGGQAYKIGLRAGDVIKAINNQPISNGDDMINLIHMNYGHPLTLLVKRDDKSLTFTGTPQQLTDYSDNPAYAEKVIKPNSLARVGLRPGDIINSINEVTLSNAAVMKGVLKDNTGKLTKIGVWRNNQESYIEATITPAILSALPTYTNYPLGMLKFQPMMAVQRVSLKESVKDGFAITAGMFSSIGAMFQHHQVKELKESAGGIVYMYSMTGVAVKDGMSQVIMIAAELSISLAVFNLLPIPVLDGGHLLTFFIEWVRRGRRMTESQQQAFLLTGMAVIGVLFVLIFTNDIHRLISHQVPQ